MPRGDVAEFVRDHGRQLIFVIQMGKHPARDIDISAGKRHGVDDGTIEDPERNRGIANLLVSAGTPQMTGCQHAITNIVNVALQVRVAVSTEESGDFLAGFFADLGFLLPGVAEITPFPRSWNDIGDAAINQQADQ